MPDFRPAWIGPLVRSPVLRQTVTVVAASDLDRARAFSLVPPAEAPVPDEWPLEKIERALNGCRYIPWPEEGTWVACCERPCVLVCIGGARDSQLEIPPDAAIHYTEAEWPQDWRPGESPEPPSGLLGRLRDAFRQPTPGETYERYRLEAMEGSEGVHLMHCYACGSLYFASHHP